MYFKDTKTTKLVPVGRVDREATILSEAVAERMGKLAFLLVQVGKGNDWDAAIYRLDLRSNKTAKIYSAKAHNQTEGINRLSIAPSGQSLVFMGTRFVNEPMPEGAVEHHPLEAVGIHLILGDYANPAIPNPRPSSLKTQYFEVNKKVIGGFACFDRQSRLKTCSSRP